MFRKILKRGRPKRGPRIDKHLDITRAAIRLLARKDFEAISMAELARESACSVGALYGRFSDKHACLSYTINSAHRSMTHTTVATLSATRHLSPATRAERFVDHVVSSMTNPKTAGVIRATMKLATVRPHALDALEEYRETVSKCAVALFANSRLPAGNIRIATQILLSTITDSVMLKNPGTMSAGSRRMKSALTNILIGYLGISKTAKWAKTEATDDEEPIDGEIFDTPPEGEKIAYDPDLRAYRRSPVKRATEKRSEHSSPKPKKFAPTKMAKSKPEKPPTTRRRHTVI